LLLIRSLLARNQSLREDAITPSLAPLAALGPLARGAGACLVEDLWGKGAAMGASR